MLNVLKNTKTAVGIDISDYSIEVVCLEKKAGVITIKNKARCILEPGVVSRGKVKDKKKLIENLKSVLSEAGVKIGRLTKNYYTSIPENLVYTYVFGVDYINSENISSKAIKQIKRTMPIDFNKLIYDYRIINTKKDEQTGKYKALILSVATSVTWLKDWQNCINQAGLMISDFNIESLAIFRSLYKEHPKAITCLVDIGKVNTNFSVFDKIGLIYSRSLKFASGNITDRLVKEAGLSYLRAEELKTQKGLSAGNKDKVARKIIKESIDVILEETRILDSYVRLIYKKKIRKYVLVGGGSKLKGLIGYCKRSDFFSNNIELAKPERDYFSANVFYYQAIGLALCGFEKKWKDVNPSLSLKQNPVKEITTLKTRFFSKSIKKYLFTVLFLTLIIISGFYINRNFTFFGLEKKNINSSVLNYDFKLGVYISTNKIIYPDSEVFGRIIETVINSAENKDSIIASGRKNAQEHLAENEELYFIPLNIQELNKESLIFPLSLNWLVYKKDELEKLLIEKVEREVKGDYKINDIEFEKLEKSDKDLYHINVLLKIKTKNILGKSFFNIESSKPRKISTVKINNLSTGVNIRQGPGIDYKILEYAQPAAEYRLIKQDGSWCEIMLGATSSGWVHSSLIEIIE